MRTNIAIVGSTGNAGRKTIEVLERRKFPINTLYLLASKKSIGKSIKFRNKNIIVKSLEDFDFKKVDITFFCAGSKLAKTWAPKIAKDSIILKTFQNVPTVKPTEGYYEIMQESNQIDPETGRKSRYPVARLPIANTIMFIEK